jgi:hypothetical protein
MAESRPKRLDRNDATSEDIREERATLTFVLSAPLISVAESVLATIVAWSLVFGIPEGVDVLQSAIPRNATFWWSIVFTSATVGILVGLAFQRFSKRWLAMSVLLSWGNAIYFGLNLYGAFVMRSV